jgi:hypothetical protein
LAGFNEQCNFRGLSERKGGALHGQLFWLVILKRKGGAPLGTIDWF